MPAQLHWLDGPWTGKLALEARPRGADWLDDALEQWKRAGVDEVVSLLTSEEEEDLGLLAEAEKTRMQGMEFTSLPIRDRQVPESEAKLGETLARISRQLSAGRNLLLHCRQGVGRTGLVAACLLIKNGMSPGAAVEAVSAARGITIPETPEQRDFIDRYAPAFSK